MMSRTSLYKRIRSLGIQIDAGGVDAAAGETATGDDASTAHTDDDEQD